MPGNRNILKTTFQDININVIRILNEPTAATLAYIHNTNEQNTNEQTMDEEKKLLCLVYMDFAKI